MIGLRVRFRPMIGLVAAWRPVIGPGVRIRGMIGLVGGCRHEVASTWELVQLYSPSRGVHPL